MHDHFPYPQRPVDATGVGQVWSMVLDLWRQKVGNQSWSKFAAWAMENAGLDEYPEGPEALDMGDWITIRMALQLWTKDGWEK